eukprot:6377696-Prymnesium_polylepis.1
MDGGVTTCDGVVHTSATSLVPPAPVSPARSSSVVVPQAPTPPSLGHASRAMGVARFRTSAAQHRAFALRLHGGSRSAPSVRPSGAPCARTMWGALGGHLLKPSRVRSPIGSWSTGWTTSCWEAPTHSTLTAARCPSRGPTRARRRCVSRWPISWGRAST